jgi:hypothetical protein
MNTRLLQVLYLYLWSWNVQGGSLEYGTIMEPEEGMDKNGLEASCIAQQLIAMELKLT